MKRYLKKLLFLLICVLLSIIIVTLKYQCLVNWALMVVTLSFVFTALFKEDILNILNPPIFEIIIPKTITVEDEAKLTYINGYSKSHPRRGVYILIDIKNVGSGVAKNVKVYLSGEDTNSDINFKRYKSLPLLESWTGKDTITSIHPESLIRFTLGNVYNIEGLTDKITIGSEIGGNPLSLQRIKCIKEPTWFIFYIDVFADNAESKRKKVKIDFYCDYFNKLKITEL